MTGFPQVALGLKYELLINGTWTDISTYVYQRDDQVIERGRPTETSQIQPAQMTLTLNNQDGSFSPKNTAGQFYPYIGRNTQLRCSINTTSSTGTAYSGFRFWGEVSSWPPQWDQTGNDVYVQIQVGGILRRYIQGSNLGSALRRFYMLKTDVTTPVAYWPCEEGTTASQLGNLITPGDDITWTGTPTLSSNSDFKGSDPIPLVSMSSWTGLTGLFSSSGPITFSTPGTTLWTAPGGITSLTTAECWAAGGGGGNGGWRSGGSGGEYAKETSVAVTPAKQYTVTVGAGGAAGGLAAGGGAIAGSAGGSSIFPGDAVTTTAHGGAGGANGSAAGGTGSTNTTHFNGGAGGPPTGNLGGSGGGGSAGTAAAGNAGTTSTGNTGAAGGVAVTGGGTGGRGGNGGFGVDQGGFSGTVPGSGGGGGGFNGSNNAAHSGGTGSAGKVTLNWASSTTPNNLVCRFLISIPAASTPANGATLFRAIISSGTLSKIECYYSTASNGQLSIRGFNTSATKVFDSAGALAGNANGLPLMVSLELAKNGTGINWNIQVAQTNSGPISFSWGSGTLASSTMGACSQILVAPNSDINDTAMGHIVVQYALESLGLVADSINGHDGEAVTNRFARLCTEEGFTGTPLFNETKDHWGFEAGTQSWTAASNCTIAQTTYSQPNLGFAGAVWPTEGTHSLAVTPSTNAVFFARSPTGTSGVPVVPGDVVCVSADFSAESLAATASMNQPTLGIEWFTAAGASISVSSTIGLGVLSQGVNQRVNATGTAPATAAFFAIRAGAQQWLTASNILVVDNVTIGPLMGPQRNESFTDLLQEIEDAGQGQLIEARDMLGMYYRTRLSMIGQSAAVTWNYTAAMLAGSLQPAYDDALTRNDIAISRLSGSTITQQLINGALSINTPPNGVGDYNYTATINVQLDAQLTNLTLWILSLGTVDQYRYPVVTLDLTRTEVAGSGVFNNTALLDVGAYFQITNPPVWVPESPVKQLCWGFTETLNAFKWTIGVNGVPETPYETTVYGWW